MTSHEGVQKGTTSHEGLRTGGATGSGSGPESPAPTAPGRAKDSASRQQRHGEESGGSPADDGDLADPSRDKHRGTLGPVPPGEK